MNNSVHNICKIICLKGSKCHYTCKIMGLRDLGGAYFVIL